MNGGLGVNTCIPVMRRVRQIHFIGIGGSGMSGIAEVLLSLGYRVTGSDARLSAATQRLTGLGAQIYEAHQATQIQGCDAVVISSAIAHDNPELVAARAARIPVVPRAEMLAELMRFRHGIAIAGTHGKTTTTSLVTSILAEAGYDPTFVIGGRLNSAGAHAQLGAGRYLVAEADESDASFLHLQPMVAIVTNIDADHMGTYGGDFDRLRETFLSFIHHLPFYGLAVLCLDDPEVRGLLPRINRPVISYGFSQEADIQAFAVRQEGLRSFFSVRAGTEEFEVMLNLPGRHNVQNALAAIAVAREEGVSRPALLRALGQFQGIGRRCQDWGTLALPTGTVRLLDDYGHHPREIAATTQGVRSAFPGQRIVLVFQPHRYSRTRDLFDDFARVLAEQDLLVLLEVYPAGEALIHGAEGRSLARAVRDRAPRLSVVLAQSVAECLELLPGILQAEDVLLLMGAGDIGGLPKQLQQRWGHGET